MIGATGIANGTKGLVPQPLIANQLSFLRGDGIWAMPAGAGDMVLATAQTNSGLKTYLD